MKLLRKFLSTTILVTTVLLSPLAQAQSCHGKLLNPISDVDYNNTFPWTVAGVRTPSSNTDPAHMKLSPICLCPGRLFGLPTPGIGITYWAPKYVVEVERSPGCFSTIGGVELLPGFKNLHSEQKIEGSNTGGKATRMQVHWYAYPLFALLDMFKSFGCVSAPSLGLAGISEITPTWQNDAWAALLAPESALFATQAAQLMCTVDAVAASIKQPLAPLFWCAGTWGSLYPLSGNTINVDSNFVANHLTAAKFSAMYSKLGLVLQTIGPTASCTPHYNPIFDKSQFRYNQVAPIPTKGTAVVTGDPGILVVPPVKNYPTRESTSIMIWEGQQCCLHF